MHSNTIRSLHYFRVESELCWSRLCLLTSFRHWCLNCYIFLIGSATIHLKLIGPSDTHAYTETPIRSFKQSEEFFFKFTQTQQLKWCVTVCTPIWEWISRTIRQFQESPAAAQFSSLTCRLRVNGQHYSVRFFNLIFSSTFYTPTARHMCLSLHSLWKWLPAQKEYRVQEKLRCSAENSVR